MRAGSQNYQDIRYGMIENCFLWYVYMHTTLVFLKTISQGMSRTENQSLSPFFSTFIVLLLLLYILDQIYF